MAEQTEACVHCGKPLRRLRGQWSADFAGWELVCPDRPPGTGTSHQHAPAPASTTPPEPQTAVDYFKEAYRRTLESEGKLLARVSELEGALREAEIELRQARGLKALLANGMPPTGNPDFDEVLATHPIAAMIQRGWLAWVTGFDDLPALEDAICRFYGVGTIAEAVNPPWPVSRPAQNGEPNAPEKT